MDSIQRVPFGRRIAVSSSSLDRPNHMSSSYARPSDASRRPRRITILASISCVAMIAAALVWHLPQLDFALLRYRARSSLVEITDRGRVTAYSLNEKQTRKLLTAIESQTHTTVSRMSVKYLYHLDVYVMDARSVCLREIWVHENYRPDPDVGPESDIIEILLNLAEDGVPQHPGSYERCCDGESWMERVY